MLPPGLDPAQHKQLLLPRSDGRCGLCLTGWQTAATGRAVRPCSQIRTPTFRLAVQRARSLRSLCNRAPSSAAATTLCELQAHMQPPFTGTERPRLCAGCSQRPSYKPSSLICCRPWTPDPRRFRYIRAFTYDEGVPRPQPPQLLVQDTPAAKAAEAELLAAAVAGSRSGCGPFVPPQYRNAPLWDARRVIQTQQEAGDAENGPHQLLARLNGGVLPWTSLMRKGKGGATEVREASAPCRVGLCWVGLGANWGCTLLLGVCLGRVACVTASRHAKGG